MRLATLTAIALSLLMGTDVRAQNAPTNGRSAALEARAGIVTQSPVVDGRLDDAAWASAEPLAGFVQREPTEGRPVSERTEVRVVFDEEALYVGAWMYDRDPDGIVFGETRRDASLRNNDAFQVIFDTYLDRQNGFVFGTTPAGIQYDGQVVNEGQGGGTTGGRQQRGSGGGFNLNWDGSWEVRTSRNADGWYAEMRIPFSTLRYPKGGEQLWGVNFARNIRRNNEEAIWAPVPRQYTLHRVSLAGTLTGFQAPATRVLTVTPYTLGETFKDYSAVTPEWDREASFGLDAKVGLTQSLTMDLTVNTDFAQAEVDDQQVNLTRFPLFFPEKRRFFLENAGTFSVGTGRSAELFFSRRIGLASGSEVPIRAGGRVSGRLGGLQVGFLDIQTGDLQVADPLDPLTAPEQIAPANNFGVVRVYKELENRTQLGAIFVSRINTDQTSDNNFTYGVDGALGIGEALTFSGWAAGTATPGLTGGEYGFHGDVQYLTRDWEVATRYRQIGADFNPEVGFVSRRAYRYVYGRALYHVRTPSVSWFREFRPHISYEEYWDLDGFSETSTIHIDNHFAFENGAFFQLPGFDITGEGLQEPFTIREATPTSPAIVIPAGSYRNLDWEFRAYTNRSTPLSFSTGWNWGGFYSGTRFGPNATLSYRFQDRLVTSLTANYFDVRLDEGSFTTSVWRFRGVYSFTPNIYLQATLQYNDDTEDFGSNVQFGWLDTAGTGLYVVYNDTQHLGSLTRTGIAHGPKARQLILKYTKLLDFRR
jgi:hypothetical protein